MKHNFLILIAIFCLMVISCNKIDKEKLKVIDNLELGMPKDSFNKQYTKEGIFFKQYYTKMYFENLDELSYNKMLFYSTDLFDFPDFKNQQIKHLGVYVPIIHEGTDNVYGLNVLLGHTGNAILFPSFTNITKSTKVKFFDQNMRADLISKVESMLKRKYGEPIKTYSADYIPYNVIEGKSIKQYVTGNKMQGEIISWETDYIEIKFFKGVVNLNTTFDTTLNSYAYAMQNNVEVKKLGKNEIESHIYAYISYTLKADVVKELKLDQMKL